MMLKKFLLSLSKSYSSFVLPIFALNLIFINPVHAMSDDEGSYSEESEKKSRKRKQPEQSELDPGQKTKKHKFSLSFLIETSSLNKGKNEQKDQVKLATSSPTSTAPQQTNISPKSITPPQFCTSFPIVSPSTYTTSLYPSSPVSLEDFRKSFIPNKPSLPTLSTPVPVYTTFATLRQKDKEKIISDTKKGRLQYMIAKDFGVPKSTMGNWQKKLGVHSRTGNSRFDRLTQNDKEEIMQGKIDSLAIKYKVKPETIRNWHKKIKKEERTQRVIEEDSRSSASSTATTTSQEGSSDEESAEE